MKELILLKRREMITAIECQNKLTLVFYFDFLLTTDVNYSPICYILVQRKHQGHYNNVHECFYGIFIADFKQVFGV